MKGLKCPSPFAYKKQERLVGTNHCSCDIFIFLLSVFYLHFLCHYGSSSSFFLCRFTLLVLLLLPSCMLVLCLWFFLPVAPDPLLLALSYLFFVHCVATPSLLLLLFWMNDCIVLDVVDIGLMLWFEAMSQKKWHFSGKTPYRSTIRIDHTDCQSVYTKGVRFCGKKRRCKNEKPNLLFVTEGIFSIFKNWVSKQKCWVIQAVAFLQLAPTNDIFTYPVHFRQIFQVPRPTNERRYLTLALWLWRRRAWSSENPAESKNRETISWRKACTRWATSEALVTHLQLQGLSTPHNHFHHTHSQLPNHLACVVSCPFFNP